MNIDERIKNQQERLSDRPDPVRPETIQYPFTARIQSAMSRNFQRNQRCPNCKKTFKPTQHHPLAFTKNFELMGEPLPLLFLVCVHCGIPFAPKWAVAPVRDALIQHKNLQADLEEPNAETLQT